MEWSTEVIMEFLELYEAEPCIWNPQNADHKDRHKIYDAWKRIEGRISVECSVNELKKKKENLMATYRKLALKVKNSRKTNEAYKPEWFAYERMASFLHSIYTPRKPKTSDEGPENEQDESSINGTPDPVESCEINIGCSDEESHDSYGAVTEAAVIDRAGTPTASRKRKANVEKRMDEAYNFLKQVAHKPEKDECSLFCDLLCLKLRALEDDTREIAMHEINNLMFHFKKPKLQQPYWSYNRNYQQPGYLANPVESSADPP